MIVITTPTGHIGSQLVHKLLEAGEEVRVIVRDPSKLAQEFESKVDVVQGSTDDEAVVSRASEGAESFFLVVPPSFKTTDDLEYYASFTRPVIHAIQNQGLQRVVAVSGIGRGDAVKNAGPVTASHEKDIALERTGVDFRALWCPGFFENMLLQVEPLKHQGSFFWPGLPDVKLPLVATRDIAASAAKLLIDRSWSGQGGLGVFGPEDLSNNDLAAILTEVLGKPIRYQQVPMEGYKAQLIQHGASEQFAQGLLDMHEAKDNGLDHTEPRTLENTSPTSFREWSEKVLKPLVLA